MPTVLRESAKEFIPKNAIESNAIAALAMKRAINRGNYNANTKFASPHKIALLPLTNAYPHNPKLKNVGNPNNTWFGPPYVSDRFERTRSKDRKTRNNRKTRTDRNTRNTRKTRKN